MHIFKQMLVNFACWFLLCDAMHMYGLDHHAAVHHIHVLYGNS